jgi:hypothetical protein
MLPHSSFQTALTPASRTQTGVAQVLASRSYALSLREVLSAGKDSLTTLREIAQPKAAPNSERESRDCVTPDTQRAARIVETGRDRAQHPVVLLSLPLLLGLAGRAELHINSPELQSGEKKCYASQGA